MQIYLIHSFALTHHTHSLTHICITYTHVLSYSSRVRPLTHPDEYIGVWRVFVCYISWYLQNRHRPEFRLKRLVGHNRDTLQTPVHHRDTNRISTRFFFGVKNMSRCVKSRYQEPGQGVGVGFCHSCHSVKMRQKHLGLLESSRGPPHHDQTDTCLVSDHTYQWEPFVINDFSSLTNSLSLTP